MYDCINSVIPLVKRCGAIKIQLAEKHFNKPLHVPALFTKLSTFVQRQ